MEWYKDASNGILVAYKVWQCNSENLPFFLKGNSEHHHVFNFKCDKAYDLS